MSLLSNKSVFVTVPNTGWNHKAVTYALLKIQADGRYKTTITLPTHTPYENNLHHIVEDFIANGHDFWLSMDADNPPMKNPMDLVELEKDIIGLPTPVWHYTGKAKERPVYWNGYLKAEDEDGYKENQIRTGLQKVDAIGTGCFLIHRRVFEDPEMWKGPFLRQFHWNGKVNKGNDISFCERARARGFEIYCHYDYPAYHFNELEINEVVRAFRGLYEHG